MNKLVKTFGLIGFVLLYIFAVSADNFAAINPTFLNTSTNTDSGYFKEQTTHLFSHTNQSVGSIYNFTETTSSTPKKLSNSQLVAVQVSDNILESKFVQYSESDRNFPLKFTKEDIIYPFHYFL